MCLKNRKTFARDSPYVISISTAINYYFKSEFNYSKRTQCQWIHHVSLTIPKFDVYAKRFSRVQHKNIFYYVYIFWIERKVPNWIRFIGDYSFACVFYIFCIHYICFANNSMKECIFVLHLVQLPFLKYFEAVSTVFFFNQSQIQCAANKSF